MILKLRSKADLAQIVIARSIRPKLSKIGPNSKLVDFLNWEILWIKMVHSMFLSIQVWHIGAYNLGRLRQNVGPREFWYLDHVWTLFHLENFRRGHDSLISNEKNTFFWTIYNALQLEFYSHVFSEPKFFEAFHQHSGCVKEFCIHQPKNASQLSTLSEINICTFAILWSKCLFSRGCGTLMPLEMKLHTVPPLKAHNSG